MAGTKTKKGNKGAVTNYISRAQAVRKLQISLAGFRRLCILKGIYPREPKNKKKVGKGSTVAKTYYFKKDIQFLLHEPILNTLREQKTYAKKLSKAIAKHEYDLARSIVENKPVFSLIHIIKERYPTFIDALRDLDDCLSMVFLFATLPSVSSVHAPVVEQCQRLSAEFQHYIMWTNSLRKVFLSIKGIYYQAEIKGQMITWIVPYQFSQNMPTDVDFKVMGTFLELYRVLLTFVNFRLYRETGLIYPPKIDEIRNNGAGGLAAYSLEHTHDVNIVPKSTNKLTKKEKTNFKKSEKRIESLQNKLADIANKDSNFNENRELVADGEMEMDNEKDSIPEPIEIQSTEEEIVPDIKSLANQTDNLLFSNCVFYLSREVPRYALEFVIKSFGGKVGWDSTLGEGSEIKEDDISITHHIVDRPTLPTSLKNNFPRREFIQPQYVFDCINNKCILNTARYLSGKPLPPHLSPFVEAGPNDYVPESGTDLLFGESALSVSQNKLGADIPQGEELSNDTDSEDDSDGVEVVIESDEEVEEGSDDEKIEADLEKEEQEENQEEMLIENTLEGAKKAGLAIDDYMKTTTGTKKTKLTKAEKKQKEIDERKELAKMMMSKKDRNIYNRIEFSAKRKQDQKAKLEQRREALRR